LWGSGIMKDPLVIAGIGWTMYAFYFGLVQRKNLWKCSILGFIGMFLLLTVKPYVVACFFPPMVIWLYTLYLDKFKNIISKIIFSCFALVIAGAIIVVFFNSLQNTTGQNIENLDFVTNKFSQTHNYINSITGADGSGYSIGEYDGTLAGSVMVMPQAIFTALFRPFIWESKNITTLLASLESSWFLIITIWAFYKVGFFKSIQIIYSDNTIKFCFIFSIVFSFVVGVSSGNFGSLVRYKIPMMPFYINSIFALLMYEKKDKE
jgi:hypothetical protein